jgi:hypothetical protein
MEAARSGCVDGGKVVGVAWVDIAGDERYFGDWCFPYAFHALLIVIPD